MKTTAKDAMVMTFGYFTLCFLWLLAPLLALFANVCIFLKKVAVSGLEFLLSQFFELIGEAFNFMDDLYDGSEKRTKPNSRARVILIQCGWVLPILALGLFEVAVMALGNFFSFVDASLYVWLFAVNFLLFFFIFFKKKKGFGESLLFSDLFIGFYALPIMLSVYAGFIIMGLIGLQIRKNKKVSTVLGGTVLGGVIFYLVTNGAVWAFGSLYPHTVAGLMQSYSMAIPFFRNSLLGDLFYVGVLAGAYEASLAFIYREKKVAITAI